MRKFYHSSISAWPQGSNPIWTSTWPVLPQQSGCHLKVPKARGGRQALKNHARKRKKEKLQCFVKQWLRLKTITMDASVELVTKLDTSYIFALHSIDYIAFSFATANSWKVTSSRLYKCLSSSCGRIQNSF